ncbi:conserved hypothetical protein [Ricinus communis]|uniref:CASP-like protein 3A1 n=2 Tax=Ricinus communis TaxID=3988 RepID=CSPLF_RICCO|nr:RecName: Full=CASP-like protein 3A1; Short=RcCASPL3A1 [Ricinus communis]EEF46406.1 conserved hypothetical protein [Ricinus communis]
MTNGQKIEVAVQLPESKVAATENNETMSGPLVVGGGVAKPFGRKADVMHVILRLLCTITSVTAVSFMVTAHQSSTVSIYGFMLPVRSKWSFSHSFEYLVGVSAAVAAHSLLQLLISMSRLLRKSPVIPSRSHAWLIFAGDQVFAYAMISAGAAASGVTNLNRTGIQHTALPNFCKPLNYFCNHVAVSIAFAFISCLLLAALAVQEVIWLSKSKY